MIRALLGNGHNMIHRVSFQTAPKATESITLKNALPNLLPMR
jgi:hypothetical protein